VKVAPSPSTLRPVNGDVAGDHDTLIQDAVEHVYQSTGPAIRRLRICPHAHWVEGRDRPRAAAMHREDREKLYGDHAAGEAKRSFSPPDV
jgi:hypothetical protein